MAMKAEPRISGGPSPAALFRERLRKMGRVDDARIRAQRILLALGWVIALAPNNVPAFTISGTYKGKPVVLWLTDARRTGPPRSLTCPAWIGYYMRDETADMLDDREVPRLMDFLRDHHAEQLREESAFN